MTEEIDLLRAVRRDYNDSVPLGAYADWLGDRGRQNEAAFAKAVFDPGNIGLSDLGADWNLSVVHTVETSRSKLPGTGHERRLYPTGVNKQTITATGRIKVAVEVAVMASRRLRGAGFRMVHRFESGGSVEFDAFVKDVTLEPVWESAAPVPKVIGFRWPPERGVEFSWVGLEVKTVGDRITYYY